jgi:hypothetical protein
MAGRVMAGKLVIVSDEVSRQLDEIAERARFSFSQHLRASLEELERNGVDLEAVHMPGLPEIGKRTGIIKNILPKSKRGK